MLLFNSSIPNHKDEQISQYNTHQNNLFKNYLHDDQTFCTHVWICLLQLHINHWVFLGMYHWRIQHCKFVPLCFSTGLTTADILHPWYSNFNLWKSDSLENRNKKRHDRFTYKHFFIIRSYTKVYRFTFTLKHFLTSELAWRLWPNKNVRNVD